MARESICGLMDISIKGSGRTTKYMGKVIISG